MRVRMCMRGISDEDDKFSIEPLLANSIPHNKLSMIATISKAVGQQPDTIFTIGHSTHPIKEFVGILKAFDIAILVDIRTVPRSRHNPQFGQEALARALESSGIAYRYMKDLGGLRRTKKDSPNQGWRNLSFRGYADYMQTAEFQRAVEEFIALGRASCTVIM